MIEIQYSVAALLLLAYRSKAMALHTPVISVIIVKEETLFSTHYTAVQINNCLKISSAIKVAPIKIMDDFRYRLMPSCAYHKINIFHGEQR